VPFKQSIELHVAASAWRKIFAIGLPQCRDTSRAILAAYLSVTVAASIIKSGPAVLRHRRLLFPFWSSRAAEKGVAEFIGIEVTAPDRAAMIEPACLDPMMVAVEFAASRDLRRVVPRADELCEQPDSK
jgi:hypothetical protein